MVYDPWADEADEAQNDTTSFDTETDNKKEIRTVASTAEGKVVLTFKGGRDFDAPWIVVHAADVEDALDTIQDTEKFKELVDATAKIGKYFAGTGSSGKSSGGGGEKRQNGGGQQRNNGRPKGATEAPEWAGEAPECDSCGETKVYKTAVSDKTGKPWHAWDCPDNCRDSREFINKPRSGGRR